MGIFQGIRISQKIMLLVAGLAFGFIVIGIAYYVQVSTDTDIRQTRLTLAEHERLLNDSRADVDALNSLLMELLAFRDFALVEEHERVKTRLLSRVSQLEEDVASMRIGSDLTRMSAIVVEYDMYYQDAVDQMRLLGATADAGLRLQLTNTGLELEHALRQLNAADAFSEYLLVRRFERDFIANQSEQALEQIDTQVSNLMATITSSNLPEEHVDSARSRLDAYTNVIDELSSVGTQLSASEQRLRQTGKALGEAVAEALGRMRAYTDTTAQATEQQSQVAMAVFIVLIFMVVMGTAVGVYFIYKSIVFPMAHIQGVIRRINKGNLKARVRLAQKDELGDLGHAFNVLLDERIQTLEGQSLENEQLNNSIISLIRALGAIAQKNLTIKVPVSADITGTISDAVNLLTTETAKTLGQVKSISIQVNAISDLLQTQSRVVIGVAEDERKQVIATSKALEMSARAMNEIASKAETADIVATKTIADTHEAREAVISTVKGILTIRETISETEKRMKRLGDRSQEISGIVNLINTIAERTHILALNASMHAASAGEAGKGFAVVAEEVQRLAENAREATAEIAAMVNNIRTETSDTVSVMNKLIAEVATGTRLAEQAGKKMEITEDATRQLVETVQVISHSSTQQALLSNRIRDRSNIIRSFTEKTGAQLAQQKRHTDSLKHYAEVLLERVNVFELPDSIETPLLSDGQEKEPVQKAG